MPGRRCAIFSCNNSKIVTKSRGQNIIFHNFPVGNDVASTTIRNEWVQICRRTDKFNPLTSQICSIHFTEDDYERDLKNELLGLPLKQKLKKTAVPTLHLSVEESLQKNNLDERHSRFLKRQKKGSIRELTRQKPQQINVPSTSQWNENISKETVNFSSPFHFEYVAVEGGSVIDSPFHSEDTDDVERESVIELQEKYEKLKKEYDDYKHKSQKKIKLLNGQLKYYKNKYNSIRRQGANDKKLKVLKTRRGGLR